ncbi:hypothetical protein [Pseudotenacibaculum haliotis]|uniref:Uncharacterized protein n=1 Tax=Pseudotenacibaculum haliotis TaxID=1862138 RepID=A0ABW5LMK1_9FLAO
MANTQTYKDITKEQRKEWEAKFGKHRIKDITFEVDGISYGFVLRKPSRSVMEAVAKEGEKNIAAANNIFLKNCVLGGDMEAIDLDGDVYLIVIKEISLLLNKKNITVKKH